MGCGLTGALVPQTYKWSTAISWVLMAANHTALEQLPITSAWLPQCHPSPQTSCVKVHNDDSRNEAIHDEAGNLRQDLQGRQHYLPPPSLSLSLSLSLYPSLSLSLSLSLSPSLSLSLSLSISRHLSLFVSLSLSLALSLSLSLTIYHSIYMHFNKNI